MGIPSKNSSYIAVGPVPLIALGTAKTGYFTAPCSGIVREIQYVVDVAVDDDNALTPAIGGTAITGGATTLTTSETAGKVVIKQPTAANTVVKGQQMSLATDGGGTVGEVKATFLIEQTP